jgi:putative membrane protein
LVAIVVVAFGKLAVGYARLRRNRQVRLADLDCLSKRAELRKTARAKRKEAQAILCAYVQGYPLAGSAPPSSPYQAQQGNLHGGVAWSKYLAAEQIRQLRSAQRRLGNPACRGSLDQWLQQYRETFQSILDAAAERRVHECATWVGWKTAISPNSLVDTMITLYWSFILLRDLCVIYNLRVGGFGTGILLGQVFFNAYIAGRLNEWEEHAEETFKTAVEDYLPGFGRKLVGKFAAKTGAGLANYFLVKRLGKRAIGMLRPVVS